MVDSVVQVAPDSTGKKVQTFENSVGGQTVEAQAVVLVDAAGAEKSSFAVTGTFWQATQPVSLAALPALVAGNAAIGKLVANDGVDIGDVTINNASLAVTGTFWQATQPVSLASVPSHPVTNAGTFAVQATQSGTWTVATNADGTAGSAVPAKGILVQGSDGTNARNLLTTATGALKVDGSGFTQPVSGTFWQATQPVSAASLPLPTGAATEATLDARTGALTETAPASDTASSGLNGRLQRVAQRLTSLIALFPASIGVKTSTGSMSTVVASDDVMIGALTETAPASDTASSGLNGRLQRIAQRLTSVLGLFPTAAALADAFVNPTASQLAAMDMMWNGATWDRLRNNFNTTTGDTGAKTTSGGGATQTNYNARGVFIYFILGTVSGTTPTLGLNLQWSPDGGTTWVTIGAAAANLTATGQVAAILIYPTNISSTTGPSPVAPFTSANVTLSLNAPLPRTWRLFWTIGGTTPSFTISSVAVSYIL